MKTHIITVLTSCAIGLASCTGSNDQTADSTKANTDSARLNTQDTITENTVYCFVRTDGTENQDTTIVHLILQANLVDGVMQWLPHEKDSRKGDIRGTQTGDEIHALWTYMQEGVTDSIWVDFKLSSNQLAQKPFKINPDTEREETDKSANYSITFQREDCEASKQSLQ